MGGETEERESNFAGTVCLVDGEVGAGTRSVAFLESDQEHTFS